MWRAKFSLFDLWTDMSVCSGRKCQLVWLSQRVSGDVGRKWSGHAMGSRRGQQLRIPVRNSSRLLLCWSAILILLTKHRVYGETNNQQYHTVCCYEALGFGVENHSQEVCKDGLIKRKCNFHVWRFKFSQQNIKEKMTVCKPGQSSCIGYNVHTSWIKCIRVIAQ